MEGTDKTTDLEVKAMLKAGGPHPATCMSPPREGTRLHGKQWGRVYKLYILPWAGLVCAVGALPAFNTVGA